MTSPNDAPSPVAPPSYATSSERDPRARRRDLAILLALVLGALALLSGKAFTIDDPLFLWLGQHLQSDPLDFYGFDVNWYGTSMGMWEVTMNPPLTGYGIALSAALFGWTERALHLAFLVSAAACAVGTYALAARFCKRPLAAALLGLLTPVYLISASNVMSDGPMLALWVWSLHLWVRFLDGEAVDPRRARDGWCGWTAAFLAGACVLTKYFGAALVPLMIAYALARRGAPKRWAPPLLVTVAILVAYQLGTQALYGRGLLLGAAQYATEAHWDGGGHSLGARTVIGLVFAGGCLFPVLVYAPFLWRVRSVVAALVLAAGAFWLSLRCESWTWLSPFLRETPSWSYALQLVLFGLGGAALIALTARDLLRRRDADALLLALWVFGTLFFAAYVNWVNNGRSNLPATPALGILLVRAWDARFAHASDTARGASVPAALRRGPLLRLGFLPFALASAVAFWAAYADMRWANDVRRAARELAAEYRDPTGVRPLWFYGHWGFQWYMEEGGGQAVDLNDAHLAAGERVVVPMPGNNTNVYPPPGGIRLLERSEFPSPRGLHTVSRLSGACFYASVIGPMPFVFGPGLVEDIYLAGEVVRGLTYDRSFDLQVERY